MKKVKVKIEGTVPLLLHSSLIADPLHPLSKKMKEVSKKRTKTIEDHELMSRIEFEASLYLNDKDEIIIPSYVFETCVIEGAKANKLGQLFKSAINVPTDAVLQYKGPKDWRELYKDKRFVDRRSVVVSKARIFRTRPKFTEWGATFDVFFNEDKIDKDQLLLAIDNAGHSKGLGDYRPKFGLFKRI